MNRTSLRLIEMAEKYGIKNDKAQEYASKVGVVTFNDELATEIVRQAKTQVKKQLAFDEIAQVTFETITEEWVPVALSKIFNVQNLKFGGSKRIIRNEKFRATIINKGASSMENTPDRTAIEIPTDVYDIMVDVPLFKILEGSFKLSEIEAEMKEAMQMKMTQVALETVIASTETTNANLYTDISASDDFEKDFLAALNKAFRNIKGATGILGKRSNAMRVSELPGYSERTKEQIDKNGVLEYWKGLPITSVEDAEDKNGLSLLVGAAAGNADDTVMMVAKNQAFIVYEGSQFLASNYDIKEKKYVMNIAALMGCASIMNKHGRIKVA